MAEWNRLLYARGDYWSVSAPLSLSFYHSIPLPHPAISLSVYPWFLHPTQCCFHHVKPLSLSLFLQLHSDQMATLFPLHQLFLLLVSCSLGFVLQETFRVQLLTDFFTLNTWNNPSLLQYSDKHRLDKH